MAYSMILWFLQVFLVCAAVTLFVICTAYLLSLNMHKAALHVLAAYFFQLTHRLCLNYLKLKPFAKV